MLFFYNKRCIIIIIIIIIAGMAVCGVRLFTLPGLLFVVFDVFYRDSVLGFTPNGIRNKSSFNL